jgi:hypothetical protein
MQNEQKPAEGLVTHDAKRVKRRQFFRNAGGLSLGLLGGTILGACGGASGDKAQADPNAASDADILNFALNLEYLESTFYQYAVFGQPLPNNLVSGAGTVGTVIAGQQVNFTDPVLASMAREIALDETQHVQFLRTALGGSAIARPSLDLGGTDPNGAFSRAAQSAGVVPAGTVFNPYADEDSFLLAASLFEDVGVTAYKGAAPLLANKTFLDAAAGILAAEAYHSAMLRTVLYQRGQALPAIIARSEAISNARDALDNSIDDDQGVAPMGQVSNIAPLDSNGLAFGRTYGDVLNIQFLNKDAVTQGGFFPAGVNGNLRMSSAFV